MVFRANYWRTRRWTPRRPLSRSKGYRFPKTSANVTRSRALTATYTQPRSLTSSTVYPIRRMVTTSNITSTSSFLDYVAPFQLSFLPDYTEFTALYDQYRVDKLVYHFIPLQSESTTYNAAGSPSNSLLLTAVDFDGGSSGLTLPQFLSYESCTVVPAQRTHKVTVQPRATLAGANAAATIVNLAIAPTDTWFDCATSTLPFFGCRFATLAETGSPTSHISYSVWIEAFVTFKNTR